ncbi:hypothetical protein C8Q73DRAFT_744734 [Cubamyces lactineus]|nr:hypothetical protein C8Q73DRAFT_744734 [Cubamyces lactineus]
MASSSARPLSRGAACLPCRKLKAKCDGNKPACGRCIANNRPDDCEYAVGGEVTRSRLLEENIALLEARIRELENPAEAPSVRLHDPRRQSDATAGPSRSGHPEISSMQLCPPAMPPPTGSISPPTPQEGQLLLQTFMANASQVGFFLNPARFVQAMSLPRQAPGAVSESLVNAVYLWGSRWSTSNTLRAKEAYFCRNAVQAVSGTTFFAEPMAPSNGALYTIQTEVLLGLYFMATGRSLEGKYHGVAAIALTMGSKLHQLDAVSLARAGMDPVSIGEKIHAFWAVYAMDKEWALALNLSPSICQRGRSAVRVTTPWPLSVEAYEQGIISARRGFNYLIDDYMRGLIDDSGDEFSRLAIRAKATALCDSALYLSSMYRNDIPNRGEWLAQFTALDNAIERFHRQLAAIRNRGVEDMREMVVSRTFACVAAIQLHSVFASHQPASRQKSLSVAIASARALDVIDLNQCRHLEPVIAMYWPIICKVLIEEIGRLRASAAGVRPEDFTIITSSLDRIMGAMAHFSQTSPLMASNLAEIQQLRAAAQR